MHVLWRRSGSDPNNVNVATEGGDRASAMLRGHTPPGVQGRKGNAAFINFGDGVGTTFSSGAKGEGEREGQS